MLASLHLHMSLSAIIITGLVILLLNLITMLVHGEPYGHRGITRCIVGLFELASDAATKHFLLVQHVIERYCSLRRWVIIFLGAQKTTKLQTRLIVFFNFVNLVTSHVHSIQLTQDELTWYRTNLVFPYELIITH